MPGGGGNAWPALEGAPGERPQNPKQCLKNMKLNSERLLTHMKQSGQGMNKKISEALEIVLTYSDYLLGIPLDASLEGINTKFERLLRDVENIQQGVNAQKTEIQTLATTILPQSTGKGPIQLPRTSWAQMLAMATPPPSLSRTPSNSSRSTPGTTLRELREDCVVIVKVGDGQMIEQLRKKLPEELRKMANHSKHQAAYKLQSAPLDKAQVVAAKQLKSGDLSLQLRSAAEAEVMRKHSKSWVGRFGANASVRLPSWGNIVHGVPVRSMDLTNLSKKEGIIKQILADNHHH
jgi:hypothetical protein